MRRGLLIILVLLVSIASMAITREVEEERDLHDLVCR